MLRYSAPVPAQHSDAMVGRSRVLGSGTSPAQWPRIILGSVIMAIIWKSYGTLGPGSLGAGKSTPLTVVDKHLKDFWIFCHGERPETMLPQSREHYTHIMVEVTDDDPERQPERFPRPGFYQVVGLRPRDASFLFEPV